jgi:hypothetical protein
MKRIAKKVLSSVVQNDFVWSALNASLFRWMRFAEYARKMKGDFDFATRATENCFPDYIVRHGPFRGLKYLKITSFHSTQFPKLLGSYERELHPTIEAICRAGYSQFIDIGCAEGYYAVGFAVRNPGATIYAYDTDPLGRSLCRQLAKLNDVGERVFVDSQCTAATLRDFPYQAKALIFCDVDGFETQLLTESTADALRG